MLEKNEQETFILSEHQHVCSELKQNKYRKKHLFYVRYAFSALTLLVERQEGQLASKKTEWWGAGVVVCLERGPDLHMAQLMPLYSMALASVKSLWFYLSGTGSLA